MIHVNRANATLAYLAAVLLLGGASAAGLAANLMLQLLGAVLIGWTVWQGDDALPVKTGLRPFFWVLLGVMALQFLPLPPAIWQHLPGREGVYQGFVLLGLDPPWLNLSLAPWKSLASFAWWLPALALFLAMRAGGAPETRHVIWTIGAVAAISVGFAAMQSVAGGGYFYTITNQGQGTGFFANANHQGSFQLCALALWGGWIVAERSRSRRRGDPRHASSAVVLWAVAALLLAGVILSGSLACLALLVPVIGALALLAWPQLRLPLPLAILGLALVVAGFTAFLLFGPVANDLTEQGALEGISRKEFLATGSRIVADFLPLGSGQGTFLELYRWYEDPRIVSSTFVNHAHNDLLEVLIETGLLGLTALLAFLLWFVPRAAELWRGDRLHATALAASVVIGVELVHSLADYPLRTAAMSSLVAVACVLMVQTPDHLRSSSRSRTRREAQPPPNELIRI
jgi:O-antigen ligase